MFQELKEDNENLYEVKNCKISMKQNKNNTKTNVFQKKIL